MNWRLVFRHHDEILKKKKIIKKKVNNFDRESNQCQSKKQSKIQFLWTVKETRKPVACTEFLLRTSEEKAGKIWYFIQICDIRIATDLHHLVRYKRCSDHFWSRLPMWFFRNPRNFIEKNSKKTFFTHNVIYKKTRKLLGNLPVTPRRFIDNYLVMY